MEASIQTVFLSANYDCSATISTPDGGKLEITLTGETLGKLPIDERFAKIRERCNRYIEAPMEECQLASIHYRGRNYMCRKVWYRELSLPEGAFEQTLIMSAHLCKILLHDTQCDAPEIVAEANAVDSRCAFSLEDITGSDEEFIRHLEEKYSDMEFRIKVQE